MQITVDAIRAGLDTVTDHAPARTAKLRIVRIRVYLEFLDSVDLRNRRHLVVVRAGISRPIQQNLVRVTPRAVDMKVRSSRFTRRVVARINRPRNYPGNQSQQQQRIAGIERNTQNELILHHRPAIGLFRLQ